MWNDDEPGKTQGSEVEGKAFISWGASIFTRAERGGCPAAAGLESDLRGERSAHRRADPLADDATSRFRFPHRNLNRNGSGTRRASPPTAGGSRPDRAPSVLVLAVGVGEGPARRWSTAVGVVAARRLGGGPGCLTRDRGHARQPVSRPVQKAGDERARPLRCAGGRRSAWPARPQWPRRRNRATLLIPPNSTPG